MFRQPLLSSKELAAYGLTLAAMSEEILMGEATREIRKGFYDTTYAVNDQKAEACYAEFQNRRKPHLYQRAYNKARSSVGLPISSHDLTEASEPKAADKAA